MRKDCSRILTAVPLRRNSIARPSTSKTPKRQACPLFARVSKISPCEVPLPRSLA